MPENSYFSRRRYRSSHYACIRRNADGPLTAAFSATGHILLFLMPAITPFAKSDRAGIWVGVGFILVLRYVCVCGGEVDMSAFSDFPDWSVELCYLYMGKFPTIRL